MKYRINNQVVLSQIPLGSLAAHIGSFADFINAQGYALYSIHRQVRLAADFSQWLKLKGIELDRISSDHPKQYLRDRARQVQACLGDAAALSHLIDFVRREGVIPIEKVHLDSRRRSAVRRPTSNTCARRAPWLKQRLSTTYRSSAIFLRIVSETHRLYSQTCLPATS